MTTATSRWRNSWKPPNPITPFQLCSTRIKLVWHEKFGFRIFRIFRCLDSHLCSVCVGLGILHPPCCFLFLFLFLAKGILLARKLRCCHMLLSHHLALWGTEAPSLSQYIHIDESSLIHFRRKFFQITKVFGHDWSSSGSIV